MNKKSVKRRILLCWIALALVVVILAASSFFYVKPFVFTYAKSKAEGIMLRCADSAVLSVLEQNGITYDGIAQVSRNGDGDITDIQIDINKINTLKSQIATAIYDSVEQNERYDLYIPAGTLLGSEYTNGFGPEIHFKMQLTETARVNFKNRFESTGINHVLHRILINIDISVNILMMGFIEEFSVSTTVIAAQTVMAGAVPDSFTNVIEHPGDDIADEIFNYADVE